MTMTLNGLETCPKCGSFAVYAEKDNVAEKYYVKCWDCRLATKPHNTLEEVVSEWNNMEKSYIIKH